ncbi:GFA family protein [Microbulbifer sp. YPW16]|uniref:GFA family protein n=1 Tax=Microbulbifer sp. YPW16 TaxID=2904242 RepID=UPI003F90EAEA
MAEQSGGRQPTEHRASCRCGQLRLAAHGNPVRVSICHCQACLRRAGSVFGVRARFPAEAVDLHGEWREYLRTADSGNCLAFRFCPARGASLFLVLDIEPGAHRVSGGSVYGPRLA